MFHRLEIKREVWARMKMMKESREFVGRKSGNLPDLSIWVGGGLERSERKERQNKYRQRNRRTMII